MQYVAKAPIRGWVIISFVFIVLSYVPIFLSPGVLDAFVREDRIYETLSPIYLFVTSIVFAIAFFRSDVHFDLRNPLFIRRMAFLGFALVFFAAAGEEISWGQRILGIETPDVVSSRNVQKELTFHNLDIFQGADALIPFDFGQLSALAALTLGALIPLIARFVKPVGRWLEPLFPVLPVAFSMVFIANYAIQKAIVRLLPHFPELYHHPTLRIAAGVHETREHGYEFLLMVSAIFYVFVKLKALGEAHAARSAGSAAGRESGRLINTSTEAPVGRPPADE